MSATRDLGAQPSLGETVPIFLPGLSISQKATQYEAASSSPHHSHRLESCRGRQMSDNGTVRSWTLLAAALIVSCALVAGTFIVANTINYVKTLDSSRLTVTGSSQQTITSDQVKWPISFSRQVAPTKLSDGYSQMKADLAAVTQYLTDQGVAAGNITTFPVEMTPVLENCGNPPRVGCTNAVVAYKLSQHLEVDSSDVDRVTRMAQDPSPVVNQGVLFAGQPLEYYYSKLPEIRVSLLGAATTDAKQRAEKIAQSTGAKVGQLTTADSGVIQVTPVNSTQISDQGSYDTTTIQKRVTAVVRASFTLKP